LTAPFFSFYTILNHQCFDAADLFRLIIVFLSHRRLRLRHPQAQSSSDFRIGALLLSIGIGYRQKVK